MLRVENALGRPVKRGPDGAFVTTKGAGLSLAWGDKIARRRGGSLEAKAEGGRFQLTVCLPLDGETEPLGTAGQKAWDNEGSGGTGGLAICLVRFRTLLGPNDAGRRCRSPERRRP